MDVMAKSIKFTREQYIVLSKFHDELDFIQMELQNEDLSSNGQKALDSLKAHQQKMFNVLCDGIESKQ